MKIVDVLSNEIIDKNDTEGQQYCYNLREKQQQKNIHHFGIIFCPKKLQILAIV